MKPYFTKASNRWNIGALHGKPDSVVALLGQQSSNLSQCLGADTPTAVTLLKKNDELRKATPPMRYCHVSYELMALKDKKVP